MFIWCTLFYCVLFYVVSCCFTLRFDVLICSAWFQFVYLFNCLLTCILNNLRLCLPVYLHGCLLVHLRTCSIAYDLYLRTVYMFTSALVYSRTYRLTYLLIYSCVDFLKYFINCSHVHVFARLLDTCLLVQLLTCLLVHLCTSSLGNVFTCSVFVCALVLFGNLLICLLADSETLICV